MLRSHGDVHTFGLGIATVDRCKFKMPIVLGLIDVVMISNLL